MIVRRPHAYRFLERYLPELEEDALDGSAAINEDAILLLSPDGELPTEPLTLPDGTVVDPSRIVLVDANAVPIPGLVVLAPDGSVRGHLALLGSPTAAEVAGFLSEPR